MWSTNTYMNATSMQMRQCLPSGLMSFNRLGVVCRIDLRKLTFIRRLFLPLFYIRIKRKPQRVGWNVPRINTKTMNAVPSLFTSLATAKTLIAVKTMLYYCTTSTMIMTIVAIAADFTAIITNNAAKTLVVVKLSLLLQLILLLLLLPTINVVLSLLLLIPLLLKLWLLQNFLCYYYYCH